MAAELKMAVTSLNKPVEQTDLHSPPTTRVPIFYRSSRLSLVNIPTSSAIPWLAEWYNFLSLGSKPYGVDLAEAGAIL
jgi:hypothetical protein